MVDKIYYGVVLLLCTLGVSFAVKRFVQQAVDGMTSALQDVKENLNTKYTNLSNDLKDSTTEVKKHFDKTCLERQKACFKSVDERVSRQEKHGHRGLEGDGNRQTF